MSDIPFISTEELFTLMERENLPFYEMTTAGSSRTLLSKNVENSDPKASATAIKNILAHLSGIPAVLIVVKDRTDGRGANATKLKKYSYRIALESGAVGGGQVQHAQPIGNIDLISDLKAQIIGLEKQREIDKLEAKIEELERGGSNTMDPGREQLYLKIAEILSGNKSKPQQPAQKAVIAGHSPDQPQQQAASDHGTLLLEWQKADPDCWDVIAAIVNIAANDPDKYQTYRGFLVQ